MDCQFGQVVLYTSILYRTTWFGTSSYDALDGIVADYQSQTVCVCGLDSSLWNRYYRPAIE